MTSDLFKRDIVERSVATFAQAFLSVFVVPDLSTAKAAWTAGVAAVLAVVKSAAKARLSKDA